MARETLHIVTLRRTRYNDRNSIVTAWSREKGRVALLVAEGAGRGAVRSRALMMVPSLVECVVSIKPGHDIMPVSSPVASAQLTSLRVHPIKGMIATVIADILDNALREGAGGPDPTMSDFIEVSLKALDTLESDRAIANFLLYFIYSLARCLGIEPDVSTYRQGAVFDMLDGVFRLSPPLHPHYIEPHEAEMVITLSRLTLPLLGYVKIKRADRNKALDMMINYLSLHSAAPSAGLKSLEVMRSLF